MKCWNCDKTIPDSAKKCPFCEASTTDQPGPEEVQLVREMFDRLPQEAQQEIMRLAQSSESSDDFVREIFVGDCPKCASTHTGDAMDDPELENPLIGRCYDCGYMWCTECGKTLDPQKPECPCWDEDPFEGEDDDLFEDMGDEDDVP